MEFMCESGDCIPLESVCDGIGDCKRMDDESYGLCNCPSDKVSLGFNFSKGNFTPISKLKKSLSNDKRLIINLKNLTFTLVQMFTRRWLHTKNSSL